MAFLEFKNVKIVGISAGVPKKVVNNLEIKSLSKDYDSDDFVETTGVLERHIAEITTSDLCVPAAEKLIKELGWEKSEIESLIFVSQTADYIEPATACILQYRLGLSKACLALDINLGCSGWVYGLCSCASMMATGGVRKSLLLCGDAKRISPEDDPLFGYAGTVTALEYKDGEPGFQFHLGTDGSGYDAIIIPDGGARNQFTNRSFDEKEIEGKMLNRLQTHMKGLDVFSFGISTVPKSIRQLSEHFGLDYSAMDYYVFHQANMKMNAIISKKLNLPVEKVPNSMKQYGNTSSASIPLTIVSQLKGKTENQMVRFICCGFGIGLSWGSVYFCTTDLLLPEIVQVEEKNESSWM